MPLKDGARGQPPRTSEGVAKDGRLAEHKEVRSKLVLVGSCACGKTALIHQYVHSSFLQVKLSLTLAMFCFIQSFSCHCQ